SLSTAARSAANLDPPSSRYLLTSSELNGSRQIAPFSFRRLGSQRYSLSRQQTTSPEGSDPSMKSLIAATQSGCRAVSISSRPSRSGTRTFFNQERAILSGTRYLFESSLEIHS